MEMFTPEAKRRLQKLCDESNLVADWKEGVMNFKLHAPQIRAIFEEGQKAYNELRQQYNKLENITDPGHYDHICLKIIDFVEEEIFPTLLAGDFSNDCTIFQSLYWERKFEFSEVLEEMSYEIRRWLIDECGLSVDPNIDKLIENTKHKVYAITKARKWQIIDHGDVRLDPEKWLYTQMVEAEHLPLNLEEIHLGLFGEKNWQDLDTNEVVTVEVAPSLSEYLKIYPKGIDGIEGSAVDIYVKLSFDSDKRPMHLKLDDLELARITPTESFPGISKAELVAESGMHYIYLDFGDLSRAVHAEIQEYARERLSEQVREGEFKNDSFGRGPVHYALVTKSKDTLSWLTSVTNEFYAPLIFQEDAFGYTPMGLIAALHDFTADPFCDEALNIMFGEDLIKLPTPKETANQWEVSCNLLGKTGNINYYILERGEDVDEPIYMTTGLLALRVAEGEPNKFLYISPASLSNIKSLSTENYCVSLDGRVVNDIAL